MDNEKTNGKLLKFPQEKQPFYEFLENLKEAYDEDRLRNFVMVVDLAYKKGEEKEGFIGSIEKYWFGLSSTACIGLCEVMKAVILGWVQDRNSEDA